MIRSPDKENKLLFLSNYVSKTVLVIEHNTINI